MTAVSKFPLLQLPDKEMFRTLREMNVYENLSFSLISKRCKKLIQSLQKKAKCLTVNIGSSINIWAVVSNWTLDLIFRDSDDVDQKKRLRAPLYLKGFHTRLERAGFEYSDWLEHIQTIFQCPPISSIRLHRGSNEYDLDEIKRVFGASKWIFTEHTGCYAYNLRIFQKYSPIEKLGISPTMFEDSKIPLNILQQNYDILDIYGDRDDPEEMTLDELLVMNSKRITIEDVRISPKDLNKFLKLWMKGSNPRMEFFDITSTDGVQYDRALVMKGIKHSYRRMEDLDLPEIYRMDGTGATVIFFGRSVRIVVWLD